VTDVLDLRDELPPRPSRRRRRGAGRWLAVLFVVLLVVGLAVGAVWAGGKVLDRFEAPPDYAGPGQTPVTIEVADGETAADVATTLREADVIASRAAFLEVAYADERASSLQPGFYQLLTRMPAGDALELLLDPSSRIVGQVTIPEGFTVEQILQTLAENTEIPLADYQAAAQDLGALGLPPYAEVLEGFLFPATYEVEPDMTAVDVLTLMVDRFEQAAQAVDLEARAEALGITPDEAVIVASLIERESRIDDELPMVATVVYNRLDQGIPLGIDAAILYGLGRTSGGLTQSDLAKDTPYNNRLNAGLPPTPIASPGEQALNAALNPAEGDWLYYVLADESGRHLFTSNYNEFLRQKEESQRKGLF
jgi:UPF0755 protein